MERNEAIDNILNDLLQTNNDRIAVYERAMKDTTGRDDDLKPVFGQMIRQSIKNKDQLTTIIEQNEGIVEDHSTPAGKVYGAWMEIKSTLSGNARVAILECCEYNEHMALKAYEMALANDKLRDNGIRNLVAGQHALLTVSHNIIRQHRNVNMALKNNDK